MIEFHEVRKRYAPLVGPAVQAVDGVTLTVAPGEILGIAGPNGAGKSTLISMLLGYVPPSSGTVRIAGMPPRAYIERHGIGYLSELMAINPLWRAQEALVRYAILAGLPDAAIRERVDAVVAKLGLEEHRKKRVKHLSKGNLQRLGLAQALLRDEKVLILDEPTHGLDPVWTQRFRDIVEELRRPDRAILIASHNLDELQRLADRVAIVDRGRVQRVVETRRVAAATDAAVTYRLEVAVGVERLASWFPGATPSAGAVEVEAPDLVSLNRRIAEAIAAGVVFSSIAPAHSALERQFREAVGGRA